MGFNRCFHKTTKKIVIAFTHPSTNVYTIAPAMISVSGNFGTYVIRIPQFNAWHATKIACETTGIKFISGQEILVEEKTKGSINLLFFLPIAMLCPHGYL